MLLTCEEQGDLAVSLDGHPSGGKRQFIHCAFQSFKFPFKGLLSDISQHTWISSVLPEMLFCAWNLQPFLTPLDFITAPCSAQFFQIINLLHLVAAPEIGVGKQSLVVVPFHPLSNDEIFPESAYITAQVRWIEVIDDGIAYSRIHEIDLTGFLQFISQVPAEGPQTKNNK